MNDVPVPERYAGLKLSFLAAGLPLPIGQAWNTHIADPAGLEYAYSRSGRLE